MDDYLVGYDWLHNFGLFEPEPVEWEAIEAYCTAEYFLYKAEAARDDAPGGPTRLEDIGYRGSLGDRCWEWEWLP